MTRERAERDGVSFEPVPFGGWEDAIREWVVAPSHPGEWVVIRADLAKQGFWGNARKRYSHLAEANAALADFKERIANYRKWEREAQKAADEDEIRDARTLELAQEIDALDTPFNATDADQRTYLARHEALAEELVALILEQRGVDSCWTT